MRDPDQMLLRRTTRHAVSLRALISVSPVHRTMVRLSQALGGRDAWLPCDVIDFSGGGVGVITNCFFPRNCRVWIKVLAGEAESQKTLLAVECTVNRVVMTDRRPAYLLGLGWHEPTDSIRDKIAEVLDLLEGEGA
ncbi:MAG: PilZ domain-containing protein [Phycisphaerales bacterium]|jgi:hypothetical protein|nr:PilZ domain-containing protein [Phycisphaerales bacterium]